LGLGKQVHLNRLFRHQRLCSVAIDHFLAYSDDGLPDGLASVAAALEAIMEGEPDAVTMFRGAAVRCWPPYAGRVPLIIQSSMARWDGSLNESGAEPEEALRLGADAVAVAAMVRGPQEGGFLRRLIECVRLAERWDFPVVLHVYPLSPGSDGRMEVSFAPKHVEYAVRIGIETGADVIKAPYSGDPKSYGRIVSACPVPVVAAGGPKTASLREALAMAAGVVASGARGMTIGRNIWGTPEPAKTLRAFKAVIHEGLSPEKAMKQAGLAE
jgi:class I fructose-bisphosphate aldolase